MSYLETKRRMQLRLALRAAEQELARQREVLEAAITEQERRNLEHREQAHRELVDQTFSTLGPMWHPMIRH